MSAVANYSTADKCEARCPARRLVTVTHPEYGSLDLCGHHHDRHAMALVERGFMVSARYGWDGAPLSMDATMPAPPEPR